MLRKEQLLTGNVGATYGAAAQIMPLFKAVGKPLVASEFTMNRIAIAASNRVFDIGKAKTQLRYRPIVSMEDGIAQTVTSFSHLRAEVNGKHFQ